MKPKSRSLLAAAALLSLSALSAHAGLVYEWGGDCGIGCTNASMQIVFKDSYVPGSAFAIPANRYLEDAESPIARISFLFGNEARSYTQFTGTETTGAFFHVEGGGMIPAAGGSAALNLCFLSCADNRFAELLDGSWSAHFEGSLIGAPPDGHLVHDGHWIEASGSGGAFHGVPEPGTIMLVNLALALLGAFYFSSKALRAAR